MRDSHPQLLETIFGNTHTLRNLQQRAVSLLRLNCAIKSLLPKHLQTQCRVANYRKNTLILEISAATWLMPLRFEKEKLLSILRQDILPALANIDIKINPALSTEQIANRFSSHSASTNNNDVTLYRKMTPIAAQYLLVVAENSPQKLREKLERLAAFGQNNQDTASQ